MFSPNHPLHSLVKSPLTLQTELSLSFPVFADDWKKGKPFNNYLNPLSIAFNRIYGNVCLTGQEYFIWKIEDKIVPFLMSKGLQHLLADYRSGTLFPQNFNNNFIITLDRNSFGFSAYIRMFLFDENMVDYNFWQQHICYLGNGKTFYVPELKPFDYVAESIDLVDDD